MSATFDISKSELERLSRNLQANANMVGREIGVEVKQRALNVAGRAFDGINPQSGSAVQNKRFEIKQYLTSQVSTHVKIAKGGKRKGRFIRRHGRKRQLMRVHLIAQWVQKKKGRKGLYGKSMAAYTGKMTGSAQKSVGFLKSVFLPLIVTLNPLCRFKFPFWKTRNISRWPGSTGYGRIQIDNHQTLPSVIMAVAAKARHETGEGTAILHAAINKAVTEEANEIQRHMEERLQKRLDKMNGIR